MSAKQTTACTVISSPGLKNYLRLVDGEAEPVTLPLTQAGPQHRSFVLATWLKSYQPILRKWLGPSVAVTLLKEESNQAETLWERTSIVTSEDENFVVHAWVCGEPGVLHYVYVPPVLRGKGIATALIRHVCGHTFEYGRPWPGKKGPV